MEVTNFKTSRRLQILTAIVAIVFGLFTVFAGSRVLLEISDPGYALFLPLLIFNTVMGFIYITAGILIWRNIHKGVVDMTSSIFQKLCFKHISLTSYQQTSA